MKEHVRVSLVNFNSEHLNRERNAARMADFVRAEATKHGAELVVFPELATTGYLQPRLGIPSAADQEFTRRLYEESEHVPGPTTSLLAQVAKEHSVHVIVGISERHPRISGALYNSAVLIGPRGELIGVYHKTHAALEEKYVFMPGNTVEVYESQIGRIGMNICYDVRFPELARIQALKGAEIIVSIWASLRSMQPKDGIVGRCVTRALENFVYFLGCDRTGMDGDLVFSGRGVIVAPNGDVLAESSTCDENVVRGTLTEADFSSQRLYMPIFRDRRPDLYSPISEPL